MRLLTNRSVGKKLSLMGLMASGVALALAFAGFMAHELVTFRRDCIDDHESTARVLAEQLAPILDSDELDAAALRLRAVAVHPHIHAAYFYDPSGRVLATYQRPGVANVSSFGILPAPGHHWSISGLQSIAPVVLDGKRVGTLQLDSNLSELRDRLLMSSLVGVAVLGLAGCVAFFVTRRLQRFITAPVSHLVEIASSVASNGDYTIRATKQSNDELGGLVDSFNAMLCQIELGDMALRDAHDKLEARVAKRTKELQQEVAERRRSEQALKVAQDDVVREKARLQLIFESVPVGICLDDVRPDGECTRFLNDAHLRISGLTLEQALQDDFHEICDPEDVAPEAELRALLDRGEINRFTLEQRLLRFDGQTIWVAYSVQRRRDADGGWHDLSTIVDITELKRAQEEAAREQARFKFIFEAVPVGISLVLPGEDGAILVNPAHERITGILYDQSAQPGIFASVTHPDDRRRVEELVRKYSAGEIDHFTIEKRYLHAGGDVVWAAMTRRLFTDPLTKRKLSVTTLVDITERREAEAKLAETHKQLLDTSRQAGMAEVATGVLHNVGNVLNSVNVSATVLSDIVRRSKSDRVARLCDLIASHESDLGTFFTQDPQGRQVPGFLKKLASTLAKERGELLAELESLGKNVEHIKDIVSMQQNYARVSGVMETVSIAELIEDALRMNVGAFERHNVAVVREYDAEPVVTVEKHKVLQILVNLLRNAKYACDESGKENKEVTIRALTEDGRVKISVIDNGVGIPAENLTRIFALGFTTRKEGHGFGLHSGALAARELGGSLIAQSDGAGCGSTFVLELPECRDAAAA